MKTGICRGGPLDGREYVVHEGNILRIIVPVGTYPFSAKSYDYKYVLGQWILVREEDEK